MSTVMHTAHLRGSLAVQLLSLLLAACTSLTPTLPPQSIAPDLSASPAAPSGGVPSPGSSTDSPLPSDPPSAAPTTSADQIVAAMEAGEIDFPTSLLYRMYAMFGDPRLPSEFDGPADEEDLAPLLLATDPEVELPDDIRALMETYIVRPTDPLSAFSGARETDTTSLTSRALASVGGPVAALACGANGWAAQNAAVPIKVWARCTGSYEADIRAAVAIANSIYAPMTDYMRPPVPDEGTELDGGDTSIDVYLTNDVSCPPEFGRCVAIKNPAYGGLAHRDWPYGQPPGEPSSGWILLRRSLMRDPDEFRRVFIHELFHVLQFAHNSVIISGLTGKQDKKGNAILDGFWFVEASAKWSEYYFERKAGRGASARTVHRDWFIDKYQFTDASLNALTPFLRRYEAYIWPFFMVQETNENIISDVWDGLADVSDWYEAMSVISAHLPFATRFRDFAVRNVNTNVARDKKDPIPKRYNAYDSSIPFPDGRPGDSLWRGGPLRIEPTEEPVHQADTTIHSLSAHYFHFRVGDSVEKFEFDFTDLGDGEILDVDALLAIRQDGPRSEIVWEHRKLPDPKAKFCRSIPEEDVQELYLVLSNHEMEPIPLAGGFFSIHGSREPCRGYEVTIVRQTTGGPFGPTQLTLTAVLEPDEEDDDDGVLEANGRGFGSYLHADLENGCIADSYSGVILMTAQIVGDNLSVYAVPQDPFFIDIFSGDAPEEGGTTIEERGPELAPGEQGQGIPSCYAYSSITQSLTIRPLEPEPES